MRRNLKKSNWIKLRHWDDQLSLHKEQDPTLLNLDIHPSYVPPKSHSLYKEQDPILLDLDIHPSHVQPTLTGQ